MVKCLKPEPGKYGSTTKTKGGRMSNLLINAEDVANVLGVSKAYAYKLIRMLNNDLQKRGFITISGRVSKQYFKEKLYGNEAEQTKGE